MTIDARLWHSQAVLTGLGGAALCLQDRTPKQRAAIANKVFQSACGQEELNPICYSSSPQPSYTEIIMEPGQQTLFSVWFTGATHVLGATN